MTRRVYFISLLSLLLVLWSGVGCVGNFTSSSSALAEYESTDNEKDYARWLFRRDEGRLDRGELLDLAEWSTKNRWQFLKLVDGFKGTKKTRFIEEFSIAISSADVFDDFQGAFADSPSRSIAEIIKRASTARGL